jgi:flagellar basal body-associated protein FliL
MSEEQENDGTLSGLKKTIIGTIATVVTGGGVWLSTMLFGGGAEETPTQQAAPAPVVVNVQQNQENTQQQKGGTNTIVKETIKEVPAQPVKEEKKSESEDAPW